MTKIELDDELVESIDMIIEKTDFCSRADYINFVLKEIIKERDIDESKDFDIVEERKNHLEDLGYL